MNGTIQRLGITQLTLDERCQSRAAMDKNTVADYAEAYQDGQELPPPIAWHDGPGTPYFVSDGFHRVMGRKDAGIETIDVEVRQGGIREAILHAVSANATHGLRRSNADKRRAVVMLLTDSQWKHWSDREIARRTSTSRPLVGNVRLELTPSLTGISASENSGKRSYLNKHGSLSSMNAVKIGKPGNDSPSAETEAGPGENATDEQPAEAPEPALKDATGKPLPAQAMRFFEANKQMAEGVRLANELIRLVRELEASGTAVHWMPQQVILHLENAKTALFRKQPTHVCPACKGQQAQCQWCKGSALVTKEMFDGYQKGE